jgi:hypothetical protein
MNANLMNSIALDIVKDKVIADKLEEAKVDNSQKAPEAEDQFIDEKLENEQEFPEIDEPDSEEERILQREFNKRKGMYDEEIDKIKEKQKRKYGDIKDIVETEFLDTMLKNEIVVCHFYHNSFIRCKIMDKHLKSIADIHPETLFVRIDAEKTPFFTAKLDIKVNICNNLDFTYYHPIQRWSINRQNHWF